MRVLVTGGTGVVGKGAVSALLERGHAVRLLARHAARDARQWPAGVEPWPGDVGEPPTLTGAADGCDAVLHVVGIVEEHPPEVTFERVNVEGTRAVVREAERAGVRRLAFVSSLGAERGESGYHRSKRRAEEIVRGFHGEWVVCRPGSVYGPGDDQISMLLRMVRTLPAIPVIGEGDQPLQPVWADDLAVALAMAVERDDLAGRTLDLAGPELTSQNDLIERLSGLTGRSPMRVPLPDMLAGLGIRFASLFGVDVGFNEQQLTMLREGVVIPEGSENAMTTVFGIALTPLADGLARLADAQPEQLPEDGVGGLERKRFRADIEGSRYTPETLLRRFREQFGKMMPFFVGVGTEPGAPSAAFAEGDVLTLSLPLRGNVQVRVEEITDRSLTLATLEGHPLAGAVRFLAEPRGALVRFEVQTYDRAGSLPDLLAMRTVGKLLQSYNWRRVVDAVVAESGGIAVDGIKHDTTSLDEAESEKIEQWLRELVERRKRGSDELSKA